MAGPATRNLELYQGDYYELQVSFFEVDQVTPKDLTGLTPAAQVRVKPASPDILASFTVDVDDPTTGVVVLSLSSLQTAALLPKKLAWDLQTTDVAGRVRTYLHGALTVTAEVTR